MIVDYDPISLVENLNVLNVERNSRTRPSYWIIVAQHIRPEHNIRYLENLTFTRVNCNSLQTFAFPL
jgi:hypothetical protein